MARSSINLLVYHAGLYAASVALLKLAGFSFYLWLAGKLPVNDYATWGLLYALQTGIASFAVVGIGEAVVGLLKANRSPEQQARLYASASQVFTITATASMLAGLLLSAPFFRLGNMPIWAALGALASGSITAGSTLQAQIVRLEERHYASLYFNVAVPLAGLIGSAIAFYLENSVDSLFLGSTAGLFVAMVVAKLTGIGFIGPKNTPAEWRPIFLRITPFIPVALFGWLGGYGNNYFIQLFFNSTEVAKFTFVYLLSSTMQLLATAMNQVWSPRFYRVMHELPLDLLERQNRNFSRLQAIVLGLAGGVLVAVYPWVLNKLGGNLVHYGTLTWELALLVVAYVVMVPWWHCSNYFLAHDEGLKIMRVYVATSVLAMGALVGLMLLFGPLGIYVGFLAQMAFRSLGSIAVARRQWPVKVGIDGIAMGIVLVLIGLACTRPGIG